MHGLLGYFFILFLPPPPPPPEKPRRGLQNWQQDFFGYLGSS